MLTVLWRWSRRSTSVRTHLICWCGTRCVVVLLRWVWVGDVWVGGVEGCALGSREHPLGIVLVHRNEAWPLNMEDLLGDSVVEQGLSSYVVGRGGSHQRRRV